MSRTGAQLLVDCLVKQGVKRIFGIPGSKIDAVFDALCDAPIELVVCRHEQNAAFMAAACGRLTGTPGVVLVTSGPGVSNLATGLLTATTEGDPVIAIGGNVERNMRLKESHQATNNVKLMGAATKSAVEIMMVESIPEIVENAFRAAREPRSGAVFISLPQDIAHEKTTMTAHTPTPPLHYGVAANDEIKRAVQLISQAKCPILMLGLEASRPENVAAIRSLLTKHAFPTVSTYQATGVLSHELAKYYAGRVGLFKNQPGDQLIALSDCIVTIGYGPVEYDPEIWNGDASKKIIHIDYQRANIHDTYRPVIELIGDIAKTILQINDELSPITLTLPPEVVKLQEALYQKIESGKNYKNKPIHPLRFIYDLRSTLSDEAIVVSDIGSHYMWLARYFFSYEPRHLLFSNGQQTLGVALPWAIAAKLTYPNQPIISISGDGGFLFSAMELETAVREKVHFVHFVWCDGKYDMVYEQELLKYKRGSGIKLGYVDIVKFAESFGARGFRLQKPDDLIPTLKEALALDGPVLIEVPIDYSDNPELFITAHDHLV